MHNDTHPNILIFMTDQQRGDSVDPRFPVPTLNLDRFHREGVQFTDARCPSPHCCPSRASFFTGLFPSEHGVWNNILNENSLSYGMHEGITTFGEDLRASGYHCGFTGKWHVSSTTSPADHGFEELPECGGLHRNRTTEMSWQAYAERAQQGANTDPGERPPGAIDRPGYGRYVHYGITDNPFGDQDKVDDGLKFIADHAADESPWCCYVGTLGPHDAYFVPEHFLAQVPDELCELPHNFHDTCDDKPGLYRRTKAPFNQLSEDEHREARRHYWAFCAYEDWLFGQLLDQLEATGQADNAVVLYVSDHGDYAGEHGLWCKGLPCFRGAYHVPFSVRWPAGIQNPGRQVHAKIGLQDWANTVRELVGAAPGPGSGRSLLPYLLDKPVTSWRAAHCTQSNGNELYGIQRSIDDGRWKYVYNGFDEDELYDLKADPGEVTNLAKDPAYAAIIQERAAAMWAFAREHNDHCLSPYVMVALSPNGPASAFDSDGGPIESDG